MKIRKAKPSDVEVVMSFITAAKKQFKDLGIDQWQKTYPNDQSIEEDIASSHAYVCTKDNQVIAYFYFNQEEDPYYKQITDGQWLNDNPYYVVHRFVVDPNRRNQEVAQWILQQCIKMCLDLNIHDIRIDTHPDNKGMLMLIEKCGYHYCGKVYVADGLRLAFQKNLMER